MPVRIRLAQRGKKKNRTFRVIVADSRSPRDGKFIEDLGYYDPHHNPSMVEIDVDKAVAWLDKGAQPSERAQKILEISGAWAQWRSTKGEVVSIPQAPEEKIRKVLSQPRFLSLWRSTRYNIKSFLKFAC